MVPAVRPAPGRLGSLQKAGSGGVGVLAPQALLWQAPQLALYQLLAQAAESHRPELSENRRRRALHPTRACTPPAPRARLRPGGALAPLRWRRPAPGALSCGRARASEAVKLKLPLSVVRAGAWGQRCRLARAPAPRMRTAHPRTARGGWGRGHIRQARGNSRRQRKIAGFRLRDLETDKPAAAGEHGSLSARPRLRPCPRRHRARWLRRFRAGKRRVA